MQKGAPASSDTPQTTEAISQSTRDFVSKIVRADDEIYREEERVRRAPIEHFIGPRTEKDTSSLDTGKAEKGKKRKEQVEERPQRRAEKQMMEKSGVSSQENVPEETLTDSAREINDLLKLKHQISRQLIEDEEPNEDGGESEINEETEKEEGEVDKSFDDSQGPSQVKNTPVLIKRFGRTYRGLKSTETADTAEEEGEIIDEDEENQEIIEDMNFMEEPTEGTDGSKRRDSGEKKHKKKKKKHHHKKHRRHSKENDDRDTYYDEESGSWREQPEDETSNKKRRHSSSNDVTEQGEEPNKKVKITKPLLSEIMLKTRTPDENQAPISVVQESPEPQRFDAYSMQQNAATQRQLEFGDGEVRQFTDETVHHIEQAPWTIKNEPDRLTVGSSTSTTSLDSQSTIVSTAGLEIPQNLLTSLPSAMWANIKSGVEMVASGSNSVTSLTTPNQSRPDIAGQDPESDVFSTQTQQQSMQPSSQGQQIIEDPWQSSQNQQSIEDPWQTNGASAQNQQVGEDPWQTNGARSQNQPINEDPWKTNSATSGNQPVSEDPWQTNTSSALPAGPRPLLSLNVPPRQPPVTKATPLMSLDVSQSSMSKTKATQLPPIAKVPPWSHREIPDIKPQKPVKVEPPLPPWERKKQEQLSKPPPPPPQSEPPPPLPAPVAPPVAVDRNKPPSADPWSADSKGKYGENIFSGGAPPLPPSSGPNKHQHPWDKKPTISHGQSPLAKLVRKQLYLPLVRPCSVDFLHGGATGVLI